MTLLSLLACGPAPPVIPTVPTLVPTKTTVGTTPTVDGCPRIASVAVSSSPLQLLERRFDVTLDGAGAVYAVCTVPSDPLEQHLVEATTAATVQSLTIRGLLANTDHECTIRPTCGGPATLVTFRTGIPPIPVFEATSSGSGPTGAYTLFNTRLGSYGDSPSYVVMVDPEGKVRWLHTVEDRIVIDLDVAMTDDNTALHLGGGWAWVQLDQPNRGLFRDVDLSGNPLLDRTAPAMGFGFNHHSEKREDGSFLSLTFSHNAGFGRTWYGVGIEQWHPTEGLQWWWDSQRLVDQGVLGDPGSEDTPYHANSVSFVADALGNAAWVSLYKAREIWRVDLASGDRTHVLGPNGDFRLRDPLGRTLPVEDWAYVQHDPDYTSDGRVLLYDNGQGRPGGDQYSRVVEYELDLDAGIATQLWAWTEPGWYNPTLGDADYLPGGNVLIARGFSIGWTPTSSDVSQIIELRPPDEVVWRLRFTHQGWPLFRAERIDGCDLFGNARYCPAIADRLAILLQ